MRRITYEQVDNLRFSGSVPVSWIVRVHEICIVFECRRSARLLICPIGSYSVE